MKLTNIIAVVLPPLFVGSIAFGATVFGNKEPVLDTRPLELKTERVPKTQDGTYMQFDKGEWKPNTRVIEYKTEKEAGYQVLEYDLRVDGTYMRSYGEGPEATERSYDWIKISDFATSTP
jgi:hypothetical protein